MVRVYPYSGRVSVSLTPFLLISVAAAIADAERMSRFYVRRASLIVPAAAVLVAANAIAVNAPPDRQEDIRSVLAYTRERFTPSDRMYVYYGAGQAFLYYASRYGFTPDQYVVASCSRHEPRAYLKQLPPI